MTRTRTAVAAFVLLSLPLLPAHSRPGRGGPSHTSASAGKTLRVGESDVYEFNGMTTAAVGSPLVADIVPLSSRRLLVNAKGVGETTLFVFDRTGRHKWRLSVVAPVADAAPLAALVQAQIGLPGVTARAVQDTLFLEGAVPSAALMQRAAAIAAVYTPKVRNLLTLLPAADDPTKLSLAATYAALLRESLGGLGIRVRVVDDRTIALLGQYALSQSLPETDSPADEATLPRFHRTSTPKKSKAADESAAGDAAVAADDTADTPKPKKTARGRAKETAIASDPLDRLLASLPSELKVVDLINLGSHPTRQILVRAKVISIDRSAEKDLGVSWGTLGTAGTRAGQTYVFQPQPILFGQYPAGGGAFNTSLLGGGKLERISPFSAQLSALITENKARVLSEPSLVVLDGSEGNILVGGEIPIPVAQASSGTGGISSSITIEYKPYGVRLSVRAALVGERTVQMTVTPEVSDLNYAASVQISGFQVPGLTVRRATSTLQMADGQTLAIGGLYSSTQVRQVQRIPLLSQIPVLGEFFKNTITRKEETELLILIQPEIVGPDTEGTRPPPPGSLENLPIPRPDVRRGDFDKDFPDLQKGGGDKDRIGPPVNLPDPGDVPVTSDPPALEPAREP